MLDPAQLFNQALQALERNNRPLAQDRLEKVLAAQPDDCEAALMLARLHRENDPPDLAAAEAVMVRTAKAARASPADATELLLELADLRLSLGRAADAARACRHALEANPNAWEAHYLLGNAFLDAKAPVEAARAFRAALATNPFEAEVWWNLGVALERSGDADGAAEAFKTHARLVADGTDSPVTRE